MSVLELLYMLFDNTNLEPQCWRVNTNTSFRFHPCCPFFPFLSILHTPYVAEYDVPFFLSWFCSPFPSTIILSSLSTNTLQTNIQYKFKVTLCSWKTHVQPSICCVSLLSLVTLMQYWWNLRLCMNKAQSLQFCYALRCKLTPCRTAFPFRKRLTRRLT